MDLCQSARSFEWPKCVSAYGLWIDAVVHVAFWAAFLTFDALAYGRIKERHDLFNYGDMAWASDAVAILFLVVFIVGENMENNGKWAAFVGAPLRGAVAASAGCTLLIILAASGETAELRRFAMIATGLKIVVLTYLKHNRELSMVFYAWGSEEKPKLSSRDGPAMLSCFYEKGNEGAARSIDSVLHVLLWIAAAALNFTFHQHVFDENTRIGDYSYFSFFMLLAAFVLLLINFVVERVTKGGHPASASAPLFGILVGSIVFHVFATVWASDESNDVRMLALGALVAKILVLFFLEHNREQVLSDLEKWGAVLNAPKVQVTHNAFNRPSSRTLLDGDSSGRFRSLPGRGLVSGDV